MHTASVRFANVKAIFRSHCRPTLAIQRRWPLCCRLQWQNRRLRLSCRFGRPIFPAGIVERTQPPYSISRLGTLRSRGSTVSNCWICVWRPQMRGRERVPANCGPARTDQAPGTTPRASARAEVDVSEMRPGAALSGPVAQIDSARCDTDWQIRLDLKDVDETPATKNA